MLTFLSRSSATKRSLPGRLGVVDDLAQLGEVRGPQVVGDVVHRLGGQPLDRLGRDLEEGLPVDLEGRDPLGRDQPVRRVVLAGGEEVGVAELGFVRHERSGLRPLRSRPDDPSGQRDRPRSRYPPASHLGVGSEQETRRGSRVGAHPSAPAAGGPMKVRTAFVSLVALALVVRPGQRAPPPSRRQLEQRQRRRVRDLGRRLRHHGRPRQGRPGRGRAQRHRPPAGLGQLRQHHQGVRGQVRHHGQLRPARRRQPGRDQRRQAAQGTDRAPDVFDLGQSVALANTDLFAPYKVATWDDIPAEFKDPDGTWVNDYGGYMSVGYDSSKVPEVTSLDDLLGRSSRARSPSTVTRPRPARPSAAW